MIMNSVLQLVIIILSVRTESARIARAAPRPLNELTADQVLNKKVRF